MRTLTDLCRLHINARTNRFPHTAPHQPQSSQPRPLLQPTTAQQVASSSNQQPAAAPASWSLLYQDSPSHCCSCQVLPRAGCVAAAQHTRRAERRTLLQPAACRNSSHGIHGWFNPMRLESLLLYLELERGGCADGGLLPGYMLATCTALTSLNLAGGWLPLWST